MQADLYRDASLSCSFSRSALTALVFVLHPDEWSVSQIRLNVPVLSGLIHANSEHTIQRQKASDV